MMSFSSVLAAFLFSSLASAVLTAQIKSPPDPPPVAASNSNNSKPTSSGSSLSLRATSTMSVASEMGGAFMSGSKCDADGNLYIRKYASDRPLLGPVVKIDSDGKRSALFDPAAFSQLGLDRADAFSPATDGGIYQIAQSGIVKRNIYVLHFSSDGSPSTPTRLDADLEVYTFAAFADGNFLVSGVERDAQKNDRGRNFTAVFSADGRELAQLSFDKSHKSPAVAKAGTRPETDGKEAPKAAEDSPVQLDLAEAEVGSDGNLYVMRSSSPALVYVIAPSGRIVHTLKVAGPVPGARPGAFHVSGNQMALLFWNEETETRTVVVADAQTGRKISSYNDLSGGSQFACFSANEGLFTFLRLGDGNSLDVIRAQAQ
jgi:hypothetical protein